MMCLSTRVKSKVSKYTIEASQGGINRPSFKTSRWEDAAQIYVLTGQSGDAALVRCHWTVRCFKPPNMTVDKSDRCRTMCPHRTVRWWVTGRSGALKCADSLLTWNAGHSVYLVRCINGQSGEGHRTVWCVVNALGLHLPSSTSSAHQTVQWVESWLGLPSVHLVRCTQRTVQWGVTGRSGERKLLASGTAVYKGFAHSFMWFLRSFLMLWITSLMCSFPKSMAYIPETKTFTQTHSLVLNGSCCHSNTKTTLSTRLRGHFPYSYISRVSNLWIYYLTWVKIKLHELTVSLY